jgi:membrane fusion protein, multidrug efflux system
MFARVTTVFSIKDSALVVPEEAIVPQGGRQFVFKVVDAPATPAEGSAPLPPDTKFVSQRQEVKLGVRRQGKVEITEGVVEGETVVLAGQQRLQRDGTALRIVELGRPPQGAASAPSGGASAAVAVAPASAASK